MTEFSVGMSLDSFINEHELKHVDGGPCGFRLGEGTGTKCSSCLHLSTIMDLKNSWSQYVDSGRLNGRSVEIIPSSKIDSVPKAELVWKLYLALQEDGKSLVRRYYSSFTCNGKNFYLRDVSVENFLPPLEIMMLQILEFFYEISDKVQVDLGGKKHFTHGNPTAMSLSFLGKLPVALKHKVKDHTYSSRYLLQIDSGGIETLAVMSQQKPAEKKAIILTQDGITVQPRTDFLSFVRDYNNHSMDVGIYLFIRGLFSFYEKRDYEGYLDLISLGPSNAKNLEQAFQELKGETIPKDLGETLLSRLSGLMTT